SEGSHEVWLITLRKLGGAKFVGEVPHSVRDDPLPFPEKFGRAMDFRRQTLVHRTIERGLLKHFAMRRIGRERDVNLGWQTDDPAWRVFRHFLLHRHGHAAQIDAKVL